MSKFTECLSKISHYKDDKMLIELETNLYVFAEAQSTGSFKDCDYTIWTWDGSKYRIEEVGIHPDL